MGKRRPTWKPRKIVRFIKNFPSGAGTILVQTDQGKAYLKAIGNPGGEHCLACEFVGTQLAQWFGLPTFDFTIIDVTEDDELPFSKGGHAKPGPAFISRKEGGGAWGGSERELKKLVNPDDLTRLVIFDTWTLNWDRYSAADKNQRRVNRDNVFLSEEAPAGQLLLKAMDHTHCFTRGRDITSKIANLDKVRDAKVYGLFPQFRPFLSKAVAKRSVQRLKEFTKADGERVVSSLPMEWDVGEGARKALNEFLVARARHLGGSIMTALWPQGKLGFTVEGDERP